jgi:hypothetical protein
MNEPWVSQTHKMHYTLDWKGATNSSFIIHSTTNTEGYIKMAKKIISEKKTMLL